MMTELKLLLKNIANLIKVKTIVTLVFTAVIGVLTLRGEMDIAAFMGIAGTIFGYYFGKKETK